MNQDARRQPYPVDLGAILANAARAVSAKSDAIFAELVRQIAEALAVEYAFIGQLAPEGKDTIHAIAAHFSGRPAPLFSYSLAGTPCRDVINQHYRYYPRDAQRIFDDSHLKELAVEGYAAIPLYSSHGEVIGLMAVMHTQPLQQAALVEQLLRIFSVRAASELERLAADRAAQEKGELYRAIFHGTRDALAFWSLDGRLVDVNPAFCQLGCHKQTGDREAILAADPATLFPVSCADTLQALLASVAQGRPFSAEQDLESAAGVTTLEIRGEPVNYQGTPHALMILRDITEDRRHEAALRQSEDRLRATVEAALDCIISMDAQGNIIEFNPAAERCFGYRRQAIVGKPLAEHLIPADKRQRHLQGMKRYLDDGDPYFLRKRFEVTGLRADGSEFPAELTIDVTEGEQGQIFITYLRDITEAKQSEIERQRLQAQLIQAQKMEAIGHLSGGIAHDFNNILTGVMGYLVMATEKAEALGDARMLTYLERASRAGQRARDLIQQMLTFSRGQRGEPQQLRLEPLIKESMRLLEPMLPASIEIHTELARNIAPVWADPVQIEQVIMNLCINARDAIGQGSGRIAIRLQQRSHRDSVCSACQKGIRGPFVELSVSDSGCGIDPAQLNRIFEPFFSTKETGKGSGMGLSTTHGIVHEYGGHIMVASVPGEGASFRLLFPINDDAAACADEPNPVQSVVHAQPMAGRVLLVDDDTTVREFMRDRLETWGLDVTSFANGAEAQQQIQPPHQPYALIILDQTMPRLTGLALAQWLRERDYPAPIILYSGYSDEINASELSRLKIDVFIKKPIDDELLYTQVKRLLTQHESS